MQAKGPPDVKCMAGVCRQFVHLREESSQGWYGNITKRSGPKAQVGWKDVYSGGEVNN